MLYKYKPYKLNNILYIQRERKKYKGNWFSSEDTKKISETNLKIV